MKNADKIINALKQAYPQSHITVVTDNPMYEERVFLDGNLIARFCSFFWDKDFDPPEEIEIKVKAPLKDFINFIDYTYQNETISDVVKNGISEGIIRRAIEKGVREWREGSQANN